MIPQSKGKIFLAEERGVTQLDWFRSHCTFNFGNYRQEHKTAFGSLYVLNDDVLAPKRFIQLTVEEPTHLVLIPVIGAVKYKDSTGNESLIVAGLVQVFHVAGNVSVQLENPYEGETVSFLQLWIKAGEEGLPTFSSPLYPVNLDGDKNKLPAIVGCEKFSVALGKFDGRAEGTYTVTRPGHGLFAFVISGVFEVQYRLLHARDGLALWELDEITFEALSNEAILLVLEVPC